MASHRRISLQLLGVLALLATAFAFSACGYSSDSKHVAEGEPIQLGELQYNVIFSRFLNPSDNEDSAYLVGMPDPPAGHSYFGVFLEVQNESEEPQTVAGGFSLTEASGVTHEAIPSKSLYAFPFGGEIEPQEQIPVLDSTAQQGPIEGSLVLFEVPASTSENRPLTLEIANPEGTGFVTLDL